VARRYTGSIRFPDEVVDLPGIREEIVELGDLTVGRTIQQPGWRYSEQWSDLAGTELCQAHHVGINLSGRQGFRLHDGTVVEVGPDDVYDIPPGHDGYTIGDEPAVAIEWSGLRAFIGRFRGLRGRVLLAILFTDLVDSTTIVARIGDPAWRDLLSRHYAAARAALERFGGREVDTTGDGLMATFDSPARAIGCALDIRAAAITEGLRVRAGVHVGEVEVVGGAIRGLAVHEAARIMGRGRPDEILVSDLTRQLAGGSGLVFEDRGPVDLKGVPEPVRIHSVVAGDMIARTGRSEE
jgi:class 3 adenylate cyclase